MESCVSCDLYGEILAVRESKVYPYGILNRYKEIKGGNHMAGQIRITPEQMNARARQYRQEADE